MQRRAVLTRGLLGPSRLSANAAGLPSPSIPKRVAEHAWRACPPGRGQPGCEGVRLPGIQQGPQPWHRARPLLGPAERDLTVALPRPSCIGGARPGGSLTTDVRGGGSEEAAWAGEGALLGGLCLTSCDLSDGSKNTNWSVDGWSLLAIETLPVLIRNLGVTPGTQSVVVGCS